MSSVTQETIARLAGVSRGTVSMVVNGRSKEARISDDRALQIMDVAKRMNYRVNAAARSMRDNRSYCIGVMTLEHSHVPEASPGSYFTILGVNDGLQSVGYVMCMIRYADVAKGSFEASRVFKEHMLDGVVVVGAFPHAGVEIIKSYFPKNVWVDTWVWDKKGCVRRDEVHSGYTAAKALIDAGYQKLLYVGVDMEGVPDGMGGHHYSFTERRCGAETAAAECEVPMDLLPALVNYSPDFERRILPYLKRGYGVIGYDIPRTRIINNCSVRARLVPGVDYGLVCCESSPETDNVWPQLTRVTYDRRSMGRQAAQVILKMLDTKEGVASELLRGDLVVGETSVCPAALKGDTSSLPGLESSN